MSSLCASESLAEGKQNARNGHSVCSGDQMRDMPVRVARGGGGDGHVVEAIEEHHEVERAGLARRVRERHLRYVRFKIDDDSE